MQSQRKKLALMSWFGITGSLAFRTDQRPGRDLPQPYDIAKVLERLGSRMRWGNIGNDDQRQARRFTGRFASEPYNRPIRATISCKTKA